MTQKVKRDAVTGAGPKAKVKGLDREADSLKNKFGLDTSPITREISKSTDLTIDLDRPTEAAPSS